MYVTNLRAYKQSLLNQVIIVNELLVILVTISMLVFTDYTDDEEAKYTFGYFVVALVFIIIVYNMFYFLGFGVKLIYLLILKYYKRVTSRCKKNPIPLEEIEPKKEDETHRLINTVDLKFKNSLDS